MCHLGDIPDTEYEINSERKRKEKESIVITPSGKKKWKDISYFNSKPFDIEPKIKLDKKSLKQSITEYKEKTMKKNKIAIPILTIVSMLLMIPKFLISYFVKKESIYDIKMKNPKFRKLIEEGYKEMAEKEVTFDNVDDIITELGRHTGWTIWDYIVSYWHRYLWNFVSDIPLQVKTFIQRGMRGWADSDTWCLDYYIATIISEGVKHLIKYGNSCWTKHDLASLKEIIKTFETANKINGHNLIYTSSKKFTWSTYKKQKRTCTYMNKKRKYPKDKKYRVMTLREVIRFEKGFDTFKEKFFYLWD